MAKVLFRAFFNTSVGQEIGISDGTFSGTQLLRDINPGSPGSVGQFSPPGFAELNGQVFFQAQDAAAGNELWVTDGTIGGTTRLLDIRPGNLGSLPMHFTEYDGKLFFEANDGISGNEPWVTDGTASGTFRLADVNPGAGSSTPFDPAFRDVLEGHSALYFNAFDGVGNPIYKTDGTVGGTSSLGQQGSLRGAVLLGDTIIGQEFSVATGSEMYFLNVNTGVKEILDLVPGAPSSSVQDITLLGSQVLFVARDATGDLEIWTTDGTTAGTSKLLDINPTGSANPFIGSGTELNGNILFAADDGVNGNELWTTDGTAAGTQLLMDINPANTTFPGSSNPRNFTQVGDEVFFNARVPNAAGTFDVTRLWKTDGTAAGTVQVSDDISFDIKPGLHAVVGDRLFLSPGFGDLYVTDGTPAGTTMLDPARTGDDLEELTPYGDGIIYQARFFPTIGEELFYSDGTNEGTGLVRDIRPGGGASSPADFFVFGDPRFTGRDETVTLDDMGETVDALGGNDNVTGGSGDDTINGGNGNDILVGAAGNDTLDGGFGTDTVSYSNTAGPVTVVLGTGVDGSATGDGTDILRNIENVEGTMFADSLTGNDDDNRLSGGMGDDMLFGGQGYDRLIGGAGDDTLDGGDDYDVADYSGASSSVIIYLDNPTFTSGAAGSDTLMNIEEILGSEFDDRLIGDVNGNNLYGETGDDVIKGRAGDNYLDGGDGNDRLIGGDGNDVLEGGAGNDTLIALRGLDELYGGNGDDLLFGGRDNDYMEGGDDADNLRGNLGNDEVYGEDGNDDARGGGGNDMLYGGYGNDFLLGENGADRLDGGQGNDTLNGVFGSETAVDTFVYQDNNYGFDRVRGFEDNQDKIDLTDFSFTDFSTQVMTLATAANGGMDTKINFGSGNVLYIENFGITDFDASDVVLI